EAPDLGLEIAPMPLRLGPPRNPPARPKVTASPATEPATAGKPSEPTIVPELSTGELQAAKADAASKIRGFMDAAREAIRNSDWQRATNMAKKAEVLSRELAEGL